MEDRARKKEQIFNAAFDEFLANGYMNARMSGIAARVGLAKATLYEYFESKERLFDELLQTKVVGPYLSFEKRLDKNTSCAARIRCFMRMEMDFFTDIMRERSMPLNLLLLLNAELASNEMIKSVARNIISSKFRVLCGLLDEGIGRGEFREGDTATMAACMIGAFNLFTLRTCKTVSFDIPVRFPESDESEDLFFEILFNGINASAESADARPLNSNTPPRTF
ncbi:MAG: TetR/AcrR family transcriptional regulator [Clostridiales Family XIII bacterium]|jgi:AcrR family transcriptional regulator|nr:TetR/AcrR family transcriptional regulator [Clostridiales Family XIII bacterium]